MSSALATETSSGVKLSFDAAALKKAVAYVAKAGTKAKVAHFAVIELRIDNGTVTLRATDGQRFRQITVATDADGGKTDADDMTIGLPVVVFDKLMSRAKQGSVELSIGADRVGIVNGRRRYEIGTVELLLPDNRQLDDASVSVTLPGARFADLIRRTAKSTSDDVTKAISGVQFASNGTHLRAASTDTYRLAYAVAPLIDGQELTLNVPGEYLGDLQAAATARGDEPVKITASGEDGPIRIDYGTAVEIIPQVSGSFPDFAALLKIEATTTIGVNDPSALIEEIQGVAIADTAGSKGPIIDVEVADGELSLAANGEAGGAFTDGLDAEIVGEDIAIRFNSTYFADGFALAGHRKVTVKLCSPQKPVVFDGGVVDEVGFTYLLMPTRS